MRTIDIFEFSRRRATHQDRISPDDLPELMALLQGTSKQCEVSFSAQGTEGRQGLAGADLTIDATLVTDCVRCGKPVTLEIHKTVPFLFVKTEAQADAIPIDEDEDFEIVVGSTKFDLYDWVQEELILSVPTLPMHEDCEPDRSALQTEETPETLERPNPFACLAQLKGKLPKA